MDLKTPSAPRVVHAPSQTGGAHMPFRSAAVLGAGTMGSQIAAHLANAGLQVLLLDVAAKEGPDRNSVVRGGFERSVKMRPAPFFDEAARQRVTLGNLEDDLKLLEGADWVIEAVVERIDVKRSVLRRVEEHASEMSIISTNTSGIPVAELVEGRGGAFARRFLGTHFFNPPRYLKLLEVIPTGRTDLEAVARVARFARLHLGKGVVIANDRPYFIGNRVGVYALSRAMRYVLDGEYSIEEIDALTGPLTGRPKSATFRTADVVGLDVLLDVLNGMYERLPDDESRASFQPPELLQKLVAAGATGAKSGAGFYRKERGVLQRITAQGTEYVPVDEASIERPELSRISDLEKRLRSLYDHPGREGRFFRDTTHDLLAYSARRVPEITGNPADIDRAIRWGFGWEKGPFQLWDTLGFTRVLDDMLASGIVVPDWIQELGSRDACVYRRRGDTEAVHHPGEATFKEEPAPRDVVGLPGIRSDARAMLWENEEAALLDIGDCVALFEFRSKGNSLSRAVMEGLIEAVDVIEREPDVRGMVIGNDGKNFSVGANLAELAAAAAEKDFEAVDKYLQRFQGAIQRVHFCAKPVVVAAHQRVLGGACELLMACSQPVASAECYAGLVEVGVGLIPAGTGTMRLTGLASHLSPTRFPSHHQPYLQKYFEQVARAAVSGSAAEAQEMGYLPDCAVVVMNDDRRLFAAREQVVRLSNMGYRPPPGGAMIRVLGRSTRAALEVAVDQYRQGGYMSEYDAHIAVQLAHVMTGGDLTGAQDVRQEYLLDLEREVFLRLLGEKRSQDRISYMLEHKKPLRN